MRDEACRSFRDGSAGGRCTGVDGVPPVSPLSTGQAPQRQGRAIEAAESQDVMRPASLRANDCATPGQFREKTRPTRGFQRPLREKTRPAHPKTAFFAHFEPAGRTFSRTGRSDVATLKPMTPLQPLMRASMTPPSPLRAPKQRPLKPTTPLHASPSWPMKPPSPLRALNTRKTNIFPAQRCHRFQPSAHTRSQRCHRFHRDEAVH